MDERELIAKIVASDSFRVSDQLGPLLLFLYESQLQGKKILARDIESDFFKHPENSRHHNPKRSRERIGALKDFLRRYYADGQIDDVACSIADGNEGVGYRIKFRVVRPHRIATDTFWEPHVKSGKELAVVCDSLLFFYEHQQGRTIRYVDTNIEGTNRIRARQALDVLHPMHAHEKLVAGHLYMDVGSVTAAELLREYFWREWQCRLPLVLEKDEVQRPWKDQSPVIIATPRTNNFMKGLFDSSDAEELAYRFPTDRFSYVTIRKPRGYELRRLKKLKSSLEWSGTESFSTTLAELTLGVISRIANPHGNGGFLTFISTDATWSAKQMARIVTDEVALRRLFDEMEWSYAEPLPPTFEILFLIRLFPGNQSDTAGAPQVICWRPSDES